MKNVEIRATLQTREARRAAKEMGNLAIEHQKVFLASVQYDATIRLAMAVERMDITLRAAIEERLDHEDGR